MAKQSPSNAQSAQAARSEAPAGPATLSVSSIGLGKMGSGIAKNIQARGFRFTVYNRSAEKTKPFVAAGATAAHTPREAAAAADVVVTSLMDDHSVFDTVSGDDGLLAGMRPGAIHIGASTVSPALSRHLAQMHAESGSHYVAGPVLGRPDLADSGKLLTFLAGKPEVIERCRPVPESYASEVMAIGEDPGAASSVKLLANFLVASTIEMASEAFVFAEKSKLDAGVASQLLQHMLGTNFEEYFERIRARRYDHPGFALEAGLKDLGLIVDAAVEARAVLPFAAIVRDKLLAADANGFSGSDWSCLAEAARREAGQPPLQRKAAR